MDIQKISNVATQQQQINTVDKLKNKIGGNASAGVTNVNQNADTVGTNVNQSRNLFEAVVAQTNTSNSTHKPNNRRDLQTMVATQTEKPQKLTRTQLQQKIAIANGIIDNADTVLKVKNVINEFTKTF